MFGLDRPGQSEISLYYSVMVGVHFKVLRTYFWNFPFWTAVNCREPKLWKMKPRMGSVLLYFFFNFFCSPVFILLLKIFVFVGHWEFFHFVSALPWRYHHHSGGFFFFFFLYFLNFCIIIHFWLVYFFACVFLGIAISVMEDGIRKSWAFSCTHYGVSVFLGSLNWQKEKKYYCMHVYTFL